MFKSLFDSCILNEQVYKYGSFTDLIVNLGLSRFGYHKRNKRYDIKIEYSFSFFQENNGFSLSDFVILCYPRYKTVVFNVHEIRKREMKIMNVTLL